MNRRSKLALALFLLGFTGILSILLIEFPLSGEAGDLMRQNFTAGNGAVFLLLYTTLMLTIGVLLGTFLYEKTDLPIPIFEALLFKKKIPSTYPLLIISIGGGLFTGLLIIVCTLIFQFAVPDQYIALYNGINLPLMTRILYGGITEEIIVRFGIMTSLIWAIFKISSVPKPFGYWTGIILSSIIYWALQLPFICMLAGTSSASLIIYVLSINISGGMVFGWLFWKKGLAVAILAHMVTHLVVVLAQF